MKLAEIAGYPYPAEIDYRPDSNACVSSSGAYLMYRLDAPEALWSPSSIDAITGREPGGLTYNTPALVSALLENGAHITNVHNFDNARFAQGGKEARAYLMEYYAVGWLRDDPEGFEGYWTEQRLAEQAAYTATMLDEAKRVGDRWQVMTRNPELSTIGDYLGPDKAVFLPMLSDTPGTRHYVVVLRAAIKNNQDTSSGFTVFNPDKMPPIGVTQGDLFKRYFCAELGMLVIGGLINR